MPKKKMEAWLSFCCPQCFELEALENEQETISRIEDLHITCLKCGFKGMPRTFFTDCDSDEKETRH